MADFKTIESNFVGQRAVAASFISALGLAPGFTNGNLSGCTVSLGTTESVVSEADITLADVLDDDGSTITISSDSADDTAAGTGARTVVVAMLNDNFETSVQVATMDGQNAVTLPGTFSRFQSMTVLTAGIELIPNEGTIYLGTGTVTAGVPANIHATIEPGVGKSIMSFFTVPKNRTVVIRNLILTSSAEGNKDVTFNLRRRLNGGESDEPFVMLDSFTVFKASVPIVGNAIYVFPEKTDVVVTAAASSGLNNTASLKADFDIVTNSRLEL